jgi:hypothetical protein
MADYTLIMDLDTLIITSKQVGANKFDCNIFRMSRDSDIDIERFVIFVFLLTNFSILSFFVIQNRNSRFE